MTDENTTEETEEEPIEEEEELPEPQMLKDAKETVERLEKANAELKRQLDRQERIAVQQQLGGKTRVKEEETPEESARDYARRALKGTL